MKDVKLGEVEITKSYIAVGQIDILVYSHSIKLTFTQLFVYNSKKNNALIIYNNLQSYQLWMVH